MGSRVPVDHYDLSSAAAAAAENSYIDTSLHDLNSEDEAADPAVNGVADDKDRSTAVVTDCMHESYQSSLPLHVMGVEDDRSSLGSSCGPYSMLTIDDVSPIETARARFMDIVVNHFIDPHVIEMSDYETDYMVSQPSQDNLSKRKSKEIRYEGDARYALPLMYIANLYETLVNEVNTRLSSMNSIRDKTIGVALEAAGGLYRMLAKKFPRKGTRTFKRRELATSFETRSKFPELVIQEEKRVRFVVVNGLAIVEKPTKIGIDDAEWFKRLTGRNEVAVSASDYKFYAPRHKYRRAVSNSNSNSNMPSLPAFPSPENSSSMATSQGYRPENDNTEQSPSKQHMQTFAHQSQFHPMHQNHHQSINQNSQANHFMLGQQCAPPPQLSEIVHNQQSPYCLQSLGHVGGRLHVLPTTKFCDECGFPYPRETSKFCSICGTKRIGT